jgi:diguanylate cyclase (GGDEF)-like protein
MNLLVISRHSDLVERLRTAFEGVGHCIRSFDDQLQALACEAWNEAHILIVDAEGEPLDGIRFCNLLRGESRFLFQSLPIFLILDHPYSEEDQVTFQDVDVDGFLYSGDSLQRLLHVLGPATESGAVRPNGPPVPILASALTPVFTNRIRKLVEHFGYQVHLTAESELSEIQTELRAPILLLGLDENPAQTLATIEHMREHEFSPYVILIGRLPKEGLQRKLLVSGVMDWLPLPLSHPRLLHACRRAMEWVHMKRIQREYQFQLTDLRERRLLLEMEASALRNEVLTDPLTGLLNRRAFNQNLEHAFNQWIRHRRPFVLILGDLDYFKLINDRFGHLVGDQVLKVLGERMHHSLRRSDLAFRIGGEEFAILLMETQIQAGADVADKLRRRIDGNPITLDSGQSVFPTMSFGVGSPGDHDAEALFMAVDQALYAAKHKGRNRIEVVGNTP